MIDVTSTAIARIEYDELSQEFIVTFVSWKTYTYYGVPRVIYQRFLKAESKGQFFNEFIRDRYRYVQN